MKQAQDHDRAPLRLDGAGGWRGRRRFAIASVAALCMTGAAATSAEAQPSVTLEVPLTEGQSAAQSFVDSFGGSLIGGSFDDEGWTTTSRADLLWIPLPAGVDFSDARLDVAFKHPELGTQTDYFESYILVSLRGQPPPYEMTPTGQGAVQAMYVAYADGNPNWQDKPKAYFDLFDSGCTDWHLCTSEAGTPAFFLTPGDTHYRIDQRWQGNVDQVSFTGNSVVNRTIDLSATSPNGIIHAPQMYLTVNACGGSPSNSCGQWDGPVHGGPLGVTYTSVELEVFATCGDGSCAVAVESCDNCAADCGPCGQGGSSAGGTGGGAAGGTGGGAAGGPVSGGGGAAGEGLEPPPMSADSTGRSDCGCRQAGSTIPYRGAMLALVFGLWLQRRRRRERR